MRRTRRKFTAEFKARVALEAIRERETLNEIASRFEVSPIMISRWKKEFLENSSKAFKGEKKENPSVDEEKLYAQRSVFNFKTKAYLKEILINPIDEINSNRN